MIGPKKLNTIRQELRHALAETGRDPIRWLEERMAVPEYERFSASGENEVLHSLRRILEATASSRQDVQRIRTKK